MAKKRDLPSLKRPSRKEPKRSRKVLAVPDECFAEQELQWWVNRCNSSELVALCTRIGLVADRTMPLDMLRRMALTGKQADVETELMRMRRDLQEYLDATPFIGVDPRACPRDCRRHMDFFVYHCYQTNKDRIERFLKDRGIRQVVSRAVTTVRERIEAVMYSESSGVDG